MMACDNSLRGIALAASFSAFVFGNVEPIQDISFDLIDVKESASKNWREYNYVPYGISSLSLNAEIHDVFEERFSKKDSFFGLDAFLFSLDDGSIFQDVSAEVWEMAEKLVEKNPKIINYI